MLVEYAPPLDRSLSALLEDIAAVRDLASSAHAGARADAIGQMLRAADALIAGAVGLVARGGIESVTGLSTEMHLGLEGRRMGSEARMIANAAAQLRAMPNLSSAFSDGTVSWGQVRAIVSAVGRLRASDRTEIDSVVGSYAEPLADTDPDRLVQIVDEKVDARRADLALKKEDRAIERGFLAVQGRLDGGISFYGEADAECGATLLEAWDAVADLPRHPSLDGPSRAQQRFDALVAICEASLAGEGATTRPRPRLLATMDVSALSQGANDEAMHLLWPVTGRPKRLTRVAALTLSCDPTVVPVVFDGAQPIEVGDAEARVSEKQRNAVVARDGGCRGPDCGAPASWCDVHHIVPGVCNGPEDLVLLCRRCHRRIHRFKWKLRWRPNGTLELSRAGRTYTSLPRLRAPPLLE